MDQRRAVIAAASLTTAALLVTACSSSSAHRATAPPEPSAVSSAETPTLVSPSTAPSQDPLAADQAAVLAQYRAWWAAIEKTQVTNDVTDPSLSATMSGKVFQYVIDNLTLARSKNSYYRGTYALKDTKVELSDSAGPATVTDCVDASRVLAYNAKTHHTTGATAGAADNSYTVTLTKVSGVWKVTTFTLKGGSC